MVDMNSGGTRGGPTEGWMEEENNIRARSEASVQVLGPCFLVGLRHEWVHCHRSSHLVGKLGVKLFRHSKQFPLHQAN